MDSKDESSEKNFSDNPQENLRIENEILKLKMQAESGAVFGGEENTPPEIENEFLLHVQQFEEAWKNVSYVKVYDLIGRPAFRKIDELPVDKVETELKKVMDLMNEKHIYLDVLGQYRPHVIYKFITEELFEHKTDNMQLPGWSMNFIYEEFHPNHKMEIEKNAQEFLRHWFNKEFNEYCMELSHELVSADGNTFSLQQGIDRLTDCLASYVSFSNIDYSIDDISFQWNEKENTGLGHAEGMVHYDALMESGERLNIEGQFKLYQSNENGYWHIFYFVMPGFKW